MDMSLTVAPKSDQTNADDLIAGPRTVVITKVSGNEGNAEQPVNVFFEGDDNKPYRPCKSMRRVMIAVWGRDTQEYIGRAMTLYRDPAVRFGGLEVGGIRISHMSHLDRPMTMALTATRANRKPYTVKPLETRQEPPKREPIDDHADAIDWPTWLADMGKKIDACETTEELAELQTENAGDIAELGRMKPKLAERLGMRFGDRSRAILGEGEE